MKALYLAVIAGLLILPEAQARIVGFKSYNELFEVADLVAIVELRSISDSDKVLAGHGPEKNFIAKVAHLTVGKVLKGDAKTAEIDLLHFHYAKDAISINGALFIDFSDADKHQYLVFLKKGEAGTHVPATSQYDAMLSVKKIVKDHFSPIESK